jgi:large subunit ribosomal protein L6
MSRVGKNPVEVPSDVNVAIVGDVLTAKGKLGEQSVAFGDDVTVDLADGVITVAPADDSNRSRAMWGTVRSLIDNVVVGVSVGFNVKLDIIGVGYRAAVAGNSLNLQVGHSHEISFPIPEGISIACERPTQISISGVNKQRVGQVASEIRSFRKPEPYKGKGIRYENEYVMRKEGKKK